MVWRALCHPSVLPLLGVTMTENRFVMVSEWMVNGNINEYVRVNIRVDRVGLVCFYSTSLSLLFTNDATASRCH